MDLPDRPGDTESYYIGACLACQAPNQTGSVSFLAQRSPESITGRHGPGWPQDEAAK